jgi:hypothetical protein
MKLNEIVGVAKRSDNTYVSPDKKVKIFIDFDDPEEREARIWFDAKDIEETYPIDEANRDWIDAVFDHYDVSTLDGNVVDQYPEDGGFMLDIEFTPEDEEDADYED